MGKNAPLYPKVGVVFGLLADIAVHEDSWEQSAAAVRTFRARFERRPRLAEVYKGH